MSLKDYIVRVYRYEKNNPRQFVGMVEEVGVEDKKAFTTYDELWAILNMSKVKKDDVKPEEGQNSAGTGRQ